jgi:hypothetical protein
MYDPSTACKNSLNIFRPVKYLARYTQKNLDLQAENKL